MGREPVRRGLVLLTLGGLLLQASILSAATTTMVDVDFGDEELAFSEYLQSTYGIDADDGRARARRADSLSEFAASLSDYLGEEYSGSWVDHAKGGALFIATTAKTLKIPDELTIPAGAQIVHVTHTRSVTELEDLYERAVRQVNLDELGQLVRFEINVRANTVDVVVSVDATPTLVATLEALTSENGYSLQVGDTASSDDACSRVNCSPPIRGGLQVCRQGGGCASNGFIGRRAAPYQNQYIMLTTGHAYSGTWNHFIFNIGSTHLDVDSGRVDAQSVFISDPGYWQPDNRIFSHNSTSYSIRGWRSRTNMIAGDPVCHSGVNSANCQGEISSNCSSYGNNSCVVRVANHPACGGDSGAPFYRGGKAYGLHVASSTPSGCPGPSTESAWFSAISEIMPVLQISILTS